MPKDLGAGPTFYLEAGLTIGTGRLHDLEAGIIVSQLSEQKMFVISRCET